MSLIVVAVALFAIGLFGVMTRRDVVAVLAAIEVMMGASLVLLIALAPGAAHAGGLGLAVARGQAIGLVVLVVAAAEAAVGLALLVAIARRYRLTRIDDMNEGRG